MERSPSRTNGLSWTSKLKGCTWKAQDVASVLNKCFSFSLFLKCMPKSQHMNLASTYTTSFTSAPLKPFLSNPSHWLNRFYSNSHSFVWGWIFSKHFNQFALLIIMENLWNFTLIKKPKITHYLKFHTNLSWLESWGILFRIQRVKKLWFNKSRNILRYDK